MFNQYHGLGELTLPVPSSPGGSNPSIFDPRVLDVNPIDPNRQVQSGDVPLGPPPIMDEPGSVSNPITTNVLGAQSRNASELEARIKAAGGALVVTPDSSEYIVAANNPLRFTVTKLLNGQFRITANSYLIYALVLGGLLAVAFLAKS